MLLVITILGVPIMELNYIVRLKMPGLMLLNMTKEEKKRLKALMRK